MESALQIFQIDVLKGNQIYDSLIYSNSNLIFNFFKNQNSTVSCWKYQVMQTKWKIFQKELMVGLNGVVNFSVGSDNITAFCAKRL